MTVIDEARSRIYDGSTDYGHPLDNHSRCAYLWDGYLKARKPGPLTPEDVCHMMILLKIARAMHLPKRDNLIDMIGYAANIEMIEAERSQR